MIDLLLLLAGFVPLIAGASLLVTNASMLARKMNIPEIVIGLTIVGFGTSAPEMVVNFIAAIDKNSGIVLGNITGSNIFNVLGILGISALIAPLAIKKNTTWLEIPLSLLAAVVILVMANDSITDGYSTSLISRSEGIIMLLFFTIFLVYNINLAFKEDYAGDTTGKERAVYLSVLLVIAGLLLLVAGGRIIVVYAVKLAGNIGISDRVIALTIVSIGTSLPELATSVMAARKGNPDIAVGNIVGSNIFNIFFILGMSAVINPVSIGAGANIDMLVNILSSTLLFLFIFTGKGRKISRAEGVLFLVMYIAYLAWLVAT